jgi:acyl dehydratase
MPLLPSLVGTRVIGPPRTITAHDRAAWRDLPLAGAIGLGLPALGALLVEPRMGISMMRLAVVAHRLEAFAGIDVAGVVQTVATLTATAPDALGETFEVHLETRDAGGVLLVDAAATILLRGPRRRDGVMTDTDAAPTASGTPIIVDIDATQARAVALALGDHNPINVDEDAAALAGLPGQVLPHLGALALAAGRIAPETRRVQARFVRPALVGDTLRISHWGIDDDIGFRVENQEGVVVIDAGRLGGTA